MGINIGIYETEAKNAPCKDLKMNTTKVMVNDPKGFEDVIEYDCVVTLENAKKIVGDWDAFMKRNRINAETDAIYMDKLKKDEDIELLKGHAKKVCTCWVNLSGLDQQMKNKAIESSSVDNRVTGWDMLSFDDMNAMCAECSLSWDKGRGCIGSFGPDNSLLPGIAEKRNCTIVASVPKSAVSKKKFTPADAEKLLKEIEILTVALPEEGKVMVRRYSGPLERMEAVAKISIKENCGFYFF